MSAVAAPPANPLEEGDQCPKCHEGTMELQRVRNCSCHINAPCAPCMEAAFECTVCHWTPDDGDDDDG